MKIFHRFLASFILCLAPALFAANAFEGKVTLGMKSGKEKEMVIKYAMKGPLIRMEPQMEGAQNMAMIFDAQKQEMIMLMPDQNMYMVMPVKGAINAAAKASGSEKTPELVKTGRTDTILGYKCEEYTTTDKGNVTEMWVTDKLGTYMGSSSGGGGGMMGRGKAPAGQAWEELVKNKEGFFPLRVVGLDKKGKEVFRMEAKEIQPGSQPASLFAPPPGYQKFTMPSLKGLFGG